MNVIHLSGRLARDPEIRKTQTGIDVCNFTIVVSKPGSRKDDQLPPDFFDCTVWGGKDGPGRAGVISKYFKKGDGIVLSGAMVSREYDDKSGNKRKAWSVNVNDFEFPMGKKADGNGQPAPQATAPAGMTDVTNQEPLPF